MTTDTDDIETTHKEPNFFVSCGFRSFNFLALLSKTAVSASGIWYILPDAFDYFSHYIPFVSCSVALRITVCIINAFIVFLSRIKNVLGETLMAKEYEDLEAGLPYQPQTPYSRRHPVQQTAIQIHWLFNCILSLNLFAVIVRAWFSLASTKSSRNFTGYDLWPLAPTMLITWIYYKHNLHEAKLSLNIMRQPNDYHYFSTKRFWLSCIGVLTHSALIYVYVRDGIDLFLSKSHADSQDASIVLGFLGFITEVFCSTLNKPIKQVIDTHQESMHHDLGDGRPVPKPGFFQCHSVTNIVINIIAVVMFIIEDLASFIGFTYGCHEVLKDCHMGDGWLTFSISAGLSLIATGNYHYFSINKVIELREYYNPPCFSQ